MNRVKTFVQKIWTYDLVHTAVYSIVLELIVECFNRRGIMGLAFPFMHPVIFIYNTLIIMTSMTLALFFKRRMFVYSVISVVWIGLAITNFIILSSRKTPFTAMDFYQIRKNLKNCIYQKYEYISRLMMQSVSVTGKNCLPRSSGNILQILPSCS